MGQIALRKLIGSTSDLSGIVGKKGDIGVDTTLDTLIVFDGTTPGGNPMAPADTVWPTVTTVNPGYMSSASYSALLALEVIGNASATVAGYMSPTDYNTLQALAASNSNSLPNSSGDVANTLVFRDTSGNFAANIITAALVGNVTGNASTATNGVVTTGSYADPAWVTSLNGNKIFGTIGSAVTFLGSVPWTNLTGKPTVVSYFTNDAGYINASGNTTGTSGGVLSGGGRETASSTPQTVVFRSSTGTAQIATPVNAGDIATKAYVDANSGGFGYAIQTPVPIPSNPFAGAGTIAPFSVTILNEANTGYIKNITVDALNLWASGQANLAFLGFTVDGKPEVSIDLATFISQYSQSISAASGIGNGGSTGASLTNAYLFRMILDMCYKVSIVVRLYTSVSITVSSAEFNLWINRYLRSA